LACGLGDFHRLAAVGEDALGFFLGLAGGGFVEILGADRGVGQHGDDARLHFEDAAGGEVSSSPAWSPRTWPGLRRVISGAWRGAMPSSPLAGGDDHLALPWKISSALTMSQRMVLMACPVSREMRALRPSRAASWPSRRLRRCRRPCRTPAPAGGRTRRR
jgi:hypothetical protein